MIAPSALRAVAQQATPGPWIAEETGNHAMIWLVSTADRTPETTDAICETGFARPVENAKYLAACDPETILALLDERDQLLDTLRATLYRLGLWTPEMGTEIPEEISARLDLGMDVVYAAIAALAGEKP